MLFHPHCMASAEPCYEGRKWNFGVWDTWSPSHTYLDDAIPFAEPPVLCGDAVGVNLQNERALSALQVLELRIYFSLFPEWCILMESHGFNDEFLSSNWCD